MVRETAKGAMLVFVAAFSASSLQALWPSPTSRWMLKNRRGLGLSFAMTHLVHLASLGTLAMWFPDPFVADLDVVTLVGGGLAYAFLVAMASTSWDGAIRAMGARRWRLLHTVGGYYIWFIFFQSYLGRALEHPIYAPLTGVLVACLGLRLARRLTLRRRSQATAPA